MYVHYVHINVFEILETAFTISVEFAIWGFLGVSRSS